MTDKAAPDIPAGMQRIYRRFERWRSSHQTRLPIPPALWASAAAAAREHGVFPTAKILRLEYAKLKRLAESATPVKRRTASPPEFLELVAPPSGGLRTGEIDYVFGQYPSETFSTAFVSQYDLMTVSFPVL